MEILQMFVNCGQRKTSVKQEFEWIGLTNSALKKTSLKELDEETVFACMMNWIINKMQQEESTKLRFRVANKVYQVTLYYNQKRLRTKDLEKIAEDDDGFILHDCAEETNYDNLTVEKMQQSLNHADADIRNKQRHDQVMENDGFMAELFDKPVTVTEEDMELINEFLKV